MTSSLKFRVLCIHRRFGTDHAIGEASFELLSVERNKDLEIELHPAVGLISQKTSSTGFLKLHLKVVLSVVFNPDFEDTMDIRSANCLKQMERIVGLISSKGFNELPPAWIRLFNSLNTISSLARAVAELDSKAKIAVGAVAFAIKVLVDQMNRDEKIDNLGRIMNDLYSYVIDACSVRKIISFEKTLQRLLTQTAECAYFIVNYQKISAFSQRAVINLVSNADAMISNFEAAFGELKIALILGSSLQTTLVSYRILQAVENIENLIRIDRLPILEDVSWDSEKTCFRGTREKTINTIIRWASSNGDNTTSLNRVWVLSGPIASGKSTIAHTVAKMFHEQNRLGAAIFLHDGVSGANSKRISSSIVHQLAEYDTGLHSRIGAKVKGDHSLIWADAQRQFRALVIETVHEADSKLLMIGPVLVVIDGLDSVHAEEQLKFLTTIAEQSEGLPSNFRILLTCRDTNAVVQSMRDRLTSYDHSIGFDDAENVGNTSIRQHISQSLLHLFPINSKVATQYQFHDLRDQLEKRARGMYLWASRLTRSLMECGDVEDGNAYLILNLLLSNPLPLSNNEAMDDLYRAIFKVHFPDDKGLGARYLFAFMLQSPQLMTLRDLERVACIPPIHSYKATDAVVAQNLGLIVEMDQDEKGVPLVGVHLSLEDFLTDVRRCQGTGVYVDQQALSTSEVCVHIMNQLLQCNICNINLMTTKKEITDMDDRIERCIPPPLRYACCSWTLFFDEDDYSNLSIPLQSELEYFVSTHILHWMEVMSLLGHEDDIEPTLLRFFHWMQKRRSKFSNMLRVLTADAIHFVKIFCSMISEAPLQIYLSALPLMPSNSLLSQCYSKGEFMNRFYSNLSIKHKWTMEHIHLDYTTCFCSHGFCNLIALGPRLAGSHLILMEAQTGFFVRTSEQAHIFIDSKIQSMAFSPEGTHLAVVTVLGEVNVYDVRTGLCIHSSKIPIAESFISYSRKKSTMLIFSKYGKRDGTQTVECRVCRDSTRGELLLLERLPVIHIPSSIALCPDGHTIAIPDEFGIRLFDLDTKNDSRIVEHSLVRDLRELDKCLLVWSPDAVFLAIALVAENTIHLWSRRDEAIIWTIDIDETSASAESYALDISVKSSRIVFAWSYSDDRGHSIFRMKIWDMKTTMQIGNETLDEGAIHCLKRSISILPDAHKIISWSNGCRPDGSPWKSFVYFFSDTTPAYMYVPPDFRRLQSYEGEDTHVPVVTISSTMVRPSKPISYAIEEDGWLVDFWGTRIVLVPYPSFDVVTSVLPTSIILTIRHPEIKKTVLKYILKWDQMSTTVIASTPNYTSLDLPNSA